MAARRYVRPGPLVHYGRRPAPAALSNPGLLDALPQIIWIARPDGSLEFLNAAGRAVAGTQAQREVGAWLELVHPDDRAGLCESWSHNLRGGKSFDAQARVRHADGWRWQLVRIAPLQSETGETTHWIGTATDIQAIKEAESWQDLVARELAHRIRNFFSVAASIVMLSSGPDPQRHSLADAIRSRFEALSVAHAYLTPTDGGCQPSFHGLLRALLAPYQMPGQARVRISGDDHVVGRDAVTALCLLFHELGTNAVKHGALSVIDGSVRIVTQLSETAMCVTWDESGGPTLRGPPEVLGFGSTIAARVLPPSRGGSVCNEWRPEGLRVRIAIPLPLLGDQRAA